MTEQLLVGQGRLVVEASRTHSGITQLVGLLWTSYQSDADNCNYQQSTYKIQVPDGIRTRNPSQRTAAG